MGDKRVVIIAMDHPLDAEAHLRRKMTSAEKRAGRNAERFPDLDLGAMQRKVHQNLLKLQLSLDGHHMGLLDLLNFVKNGRRIPEYTPDNAPQYHLHADMLTLNGVYLYQYLRGHGYEPEVVQNYASVHPEDVLAGKPLAVCISSTLTYLEDIKEIAEDIKAQDPAVPIIVGGILVKKILHAGEQIAPQTRRWISTFRGKVDAFVVEKCGEETLVKVLDRIRDERDLTTVPNLALFDGEGRLLFTPRVEEYHHVDGTAIEWDRIPRPYLRKTLSVLTSRGCNYRCRFCNYRLWFPRVQYKSIEVLRAELRKIQGLGFVKHIRFADDNLTTNRKRLKRFLEMMLEEDFDFTWSAHARVNFLDPETVGQMKRAGCDLLVMGIESGSRRILENMDKRITPGQAIEAVKSLEAEGIDSQSSFIVGYPGETRDSFKKTVDLIVQSGLRYWQAYLFYYATDMRVHEDREAFGLKGLGRAWRHDTMDAVEASRLMSRMVPMIETGFTDGQQNPWETYKLLRGEGYSRDEIFRLHRLKRELHLANQPAAAGGTGSGVVKALLDQLEAVMRQSR
jgi:radical SAM superfamily enzyme YgiQ (UPF0313 family)